MAGEWVLLHGGALGDLVLSIQLALRVVLPSRRGLTVLSRTDPGDLTGCTPAIARRSLDGLSSHWLYATDAGPPPAALREALSGRPILNALGDETGPVHRRLHECGVKSVFSFDPRARDGPGHITTQWQRDLERQGLLFFKCVYGGRDATAVIPDTMLVQRGTELLRGAGAAAGSCVLIHPGSGGREKCWPLDGFVGVARRLCAENRSVAFIIGPVERERWPTAEIERLRAEFSLVVPDNASELAALQAASAVLVSNDNGPAHLAALLGRPTVTLFGPTSADTWRPLSLRGAALQGSPDAGPHWGQDADGIAAIVSKFADLSE